MKTLWNTLSIFLIKSLNIEKKGENMQAPSEEVIMVFERYINTIKARYLLEKYCDKIGTSPRELTFDYIPRLILQIAQERDDFESISDVQFCHLLKGLVLLSNSGNPRISRKEMGSGYQTTDLVIQPKEEL
jgi:hypothetical protein